STTCIVSNWMHQWNDVFTSWLQKLFGTIQVSEARQRRIRDAQGVLIDPRHPQLVKERLGGTPPLREAAGNHRRGPLRVKRQQGLWVAAYPRNHGIHIVRRPRHQKLKHGRADRWHIAGDYQ